ncbi:MAG: hypothetical protein AABY15_09295 [Nanoarchaeota archaeon]
MNEWQIAIGAIVFFITVTGFFMGWVWKILQEFKSSAHIRMDKLESKWDKDIGKILLSVEKVETYLVGDMERPGLISKFHDIKKEVIEIREKIGHI